jgi:uncharacterized protein (DUF885 family)
VTTPDRLADELTDAIFDATPVSATVLGIRDRDDRLPDLSEAGEDAYRTRLQDILARADRLEADSLPQDGRVTLAVTRTQAEFELDYLAARTVEYTVVDSFLAPVVSVLTSLAMIGITEPAHADGYLARLAGLPGLMETVADRHRAGIAAGRLPVRRLAEAAVAHLDRYVANPAADPLRRHRPPGDDNGFATERDRLLDDLVYPAMTRYRDILQDEVVPAGRPDDRPGLCWLPDGDGIYARLVRGYTTTEHTPEELHQIGLDLIAGLRDEYAEIGARALGTSDQTDIFLRLRTDPALRWRDGEQLMAAARATIARAEQAAPQWFGKLPSQQCIVEAVPEAQAPGSAAAYYGPPALDGSRPGTYYANTYQAAERGRATYEAVAFHEAVPGHHFQIALAQELTGLPLLRRLIPFIAYAEGWGLYAERLADEMGLYSDDLARLGMLSMDSMRAARLVVDTGLHAKGWSRQQVLDYLRANTANPLPEVESETDRYIATPGQALAYMVGRLEIQRLRAEAQRRLGDRFDIRGFHDTVLGSGSLPLTVLAELVDAWAAAEAGASAPARAADLRPDPGQGVG